MSDKQLPPIPLKLNRQESNFLKSKVQQLNQIANIQRKRGLNSDLNPFIESKPKPLPLTPLEKEKINNKIKTLKEIGMSEAEIQNLVEGTEQSQAEVDRLQAEGTRVPLETIKDSVGDLSTMNDPQADEDEVLFQEQFVDAIMRVLKGFRVSSSQLKSIKAAVGQLPSKAPTDSQRRTIQKVMTDVVLLEKSIDVQQAPNHQQDEYYELKHQTIPMVQQFLGQLLDYEPPHFGKRGPSDADLNMTGTPNPQPSQGGFPMSDGTPDNEDELQKQMLSHGMSSDPMLQQLNALRDSGSSNSLSPRELDFDDNDNNKAPMMLSKALKDVTQAVRDEIDKALPDVSEEDREFVLEQIMARRTVPPGLAKVIGDLPAAKIQRMFTGKTNDATKNQIERIREKSKQMGPKMDKVRARLAKAANSRLDPVAALEQGQSPASPFRNPDFDDDVDEYSKSDVSAAIYSALEEGLPEFGEDDLKDNVRHIMRYKRIRKDVVNRLPASPKATIRANIALLQNKLSPERLTSARSKLKKTPPATPRDTRSDIQKALEDSPLFARVKNANGNGLKKKSTHRALTMSKGGKFGALQFDMVRFRQMHLHAKKGRKIVAEGALSMDLHDLLTKRYNPRRNYSSDSIEAYRKIAKLAGISPLMSKQNNKAKILQGRINAKPKQSGSGSGTKYVYYDDPKDLLERLHVIVGSIDAGNNSNQLKQEASQLLDLLKNKKVISEAQYVSILESIM
jgi:hypothetical protein